MGVDTIKCCQNKKSILKIESLAKVLKKISEPNRLKILCLLKSGEKCVCDIWQYLKLPQNLVSHHLKVLRDLNLISSKKVGLKVFYKLNQEVVKKYLEELNKLL
jgi:DNA-binding transcriptional ArsR family regulator